MKKSRPLLAIALLMIGASHLALAGPKASEDRVASIHIDPFRVQTENTNRFFSYLALHYDVPIGLVLDLNESTAKFEVEFKGGTLGELLDQFVIQHPIYCWEVKNGVIRIGPKDKYSDVVAERLLRTEIKEYAIKKGALTFDVCDSLLKGPEVFELLRGFGLDTPNGWFGSGFYLPLLGREYSREFRSASVEDILDTIIRESPTARVWVLIRHSSDPYLALVINVIAEPRADNKLEVVKPSFEELFRPWSIHESGLETP